MPIALSRVVPNISKSASFRSSRVPSISYSSTPKESFSKIMRNFASLLSIRFAECSMMCCACSRSIAMDTILANTRRFSISRAFQFEYFLTESKPINPYTLPSLETGRARSERTSWSFSRCCSAAATEGILAVS